jgi:serine/threonine-protein kinase ATR
MRYHLPFSTRECIVICDDVFVYFLQTMNCLASACKESYDRAYPYLLRLHVLQEIDDVYEICQSSAVSDPNGSKQRNLEEVLNPSRLQLLSPATKDRSLCMGVRRALYGILGMPHLVAESWLTASVDNRMLSRFDAASLALRNAEMWDKNKVVLIQECCLLRDAGQLAKALELLEPVELDVHSLRRSLDPGSNDLSKEEMDQLAQRLHLATQLMVQGKLRLGRVIERYKLLTTQLIPQNEEAHFEYGRYLEGLSQDLRQRDGVESPAPTTPTSPAAALTGQKQSHLKSTTAVMEEMKLQQQQQHMQQQHGDKYVKQAIEQYLRCLMIGNALSVQVLPRMLTLWFSFCATPAAPAAPESSKSSSSSSVNSKASTLAASQKSVNEIVLQQSASVPSASWYICLPQLVSRLGHNNPNTVQIIMTVLERVLIDFPSHSIWHVASLFKSLNADRGRQGSKLLEKAVHVLAKRRQVEEAAMLKEAPTLFSDLVRLAEELPADKRIRFPIGRGLTLHRFLVPKQQILACRPSAVISQGSRNVSLSHHAHRDGILEYIGRFEEVVDVASSKAKPKTLTLITAAGKPVRFLSKQEKDGDLRKDARLMEFNGVVNRLLSENAEGRRRCLRLRTYAVVCLNEECGLLEWVEHTKCIRHLIGDSYKLWQDDRYPAPNMREIMQLLPDMQNRHKMDIASLTGEYREKVAGKYRPYFHRWFLHTFEDSTRWLEARTRFSRSAAVWSVVGHIIGLGDRHTENILLDVRTAECVHVDFDCLFDKGLTLQKPEIVPFRLTPNMVDAMV